jgi:hypothetical protein
VRTPVGVSSMMPHQFCGKIANGFAKSKIRMAGIPDAATRMTAYSIQPGVYATEDWSARGVPEVLLNGMKFDARENPAHVAAVPTAAYDSMADDPVTRLTAFRARRERRFVAIRRHIRRTLAKESP